MKIKYLISFIIISLVLIGSVAWAQNIQYPVRELGNCKDETACKSYCDKSENTESCVNFAEKNNLMSKEEIGLAKKFMAMGSKGPGNCRGKDECDAYCNDIVHIDECVAFAEKNNLMSSGELEEAKKIQAAIKRGVKPPLCNGKKACDIYCEDPNHMEECVAFGAEAGFIQGKELEDAQKMLAAIKKGAKPPPCKGKEACDAYCNNPDNMEMCMTFAMEAGFMSEQEKADSQKMLQALKKGIKPPNCQGKDECDIYCSQEQNFNECTNFAEAAGFMTPEEAAMARKTGGKSPGNCKGKDECDAFCNNPDNQETCFNFAKENGMIPEADLKQMEEGKQKFQESLQQAPASVLDCLNSEIGTDMMGKFKSGAAMPPREIGDKMRGCFEKMGPPEPGTVNPGGQMMPQQAGPGGCKGPEECKSYCDSHPDECKNFQSGQMPSQGQEMPSVQFAPGTQPNMPLPPQENREGMMPPPGEGMAPPPGEGMMPGTTPYGPGINPQQMMPKEGGTGGGIMPPAPAPGTGPNMLPPSTAPGTGGGLTPGVFVPSAPPTEPTAPAPSAPTPQSMIRYSPFGVILNFFLGQ